MSTVIKTQYKSIPARKSEILSINVSDNVHALLKEKNLQLEIVEYTQTEHCMFLVNSDKQDEISYSYNPTADSAVKDAFKVLYEKILSKEESK